MPVPVCIDPGPSCERCCFCRDRTRHWTSLTGRKPGQQVAICLHCAGRASSEDVPTKDVWFRREKIAHRPSIGERALNHKIDRTD